jgi:hypothetical protein
MLLCGIPSQDGKEWAIEEESVVEKPTGKAPALRPSVLPIAHRIRITVFRITVFSTTVFSRNNMAEHSKTDSKAKRQGFIGPKKRGSIPFFNKLRRSSAAASGSEAGNRVSSGVFAVPEASGNSAEIRDLLLQLLGRMDALEGRMESLEGRMESLEGRMESLEGSVAKVIEGMRVASEIASA